MPLTDGASRSSRHDFTPGGSAEADLPRSESAMNSLLPHANISREKIWLCLRILGRPAGRGGQRRGGPSPPGPSTSGRRPWTATAQILRSSHPFSVVFDGGNGIGETQLV
jgi:hypothetical protein